jgi:hypothetical protein
MPKILGMKDWGYKPGVGDIAISQRKVSVAELRIYLSAPQ